jgi:hypothetical protein
MSVGSMTGGVKTFSADVTAASTARDGFEAFRREWEAQVVCGTAPGASTG